MVNQYMYSPNVSNGKTTYTDQMLIMVSNRCTHQMLKMLIQCMYSPNVSNGKTTCTHQM